MASALLTGLDYPDPDVIRVEDTYYMVTTTMHFVPGAEVLRSYDLVHWEPAARVFDALEDDEAHRLEDGRGIYGKGMWAASLRYHQGTFYVCFVANETHKTYLFRSTTIEGPWVRSEVAGFYHDPSLLFDGDRVFVAWGNTAIRITELAPDLSGPLAGGFDRVVVRETGNRYLGYEGSHLYRIDGRYYLFLIHSRPFRWRRVQACFWADDLNDEFRGGDVLDDDGGYGAQGIAQGGIVDTPEGHWYGILFQDRGAVGRIPVLVPVRWEDSQPVFGTEGRIVPDLSLRSTRPDHRYEPLVGDDGFRGPLGPRWQWNHTPDPRSWSIDAEAGRLELRSQVTAPRLTAVPNLLTQRMAFPGCAAEVTVDGRGLQDGDVAGLAAFQGAYGAIALTRTGGRFAVVMVRRPLDDRSPHPLPWDSPGVEEARVEAGSSLRLRVEARFSPDHDEASFWFWQGDRWCPLGPRHALAFKLDHFTGCRFGLFHWATQSVGGSAGFSDFRYHRESPVSP